LERDRKIRPIGNYVHDSVPVSNNEASRPIQHCRRAYFIILTLSVTGYRMTTRLLEHGRPRMPPWSDPAVSLTTKS
jgi:hypothetical protein